MTQGITLYSINHPVAPWYKRLWRWMIRRNDINEESLETIEIELQDTWSQGIKVAPKGP